MRLAVKHLAALGHTRIGFVSGPISTVSRKARLEGYRQSLQEAGLIYDRELVWEGGSGRFGDVAPLQLGRQGAHYLLSRPHPPTALCTVNDMFAFGIYGGAKDLGMKIPDDLSVLGVDNLNLTEVVEPPLTTVEQPLAEMAHASVERLLRRVKNASTEAAHEFFTPKLIVRASTARYRKKFV
jgi:DNA-binding LacI/PurR family transcriptional regulator